VTTLPDRSGYLSSSYMQTPQPMKKLFDVTMQSLAGVILVTGETIDGTRIAFALDCVRGIPFQSGLALTPTGSSVAVYETSTIGVKK
jgi:hypothetical protein